MSEGPERYSSGELGSCDVCLWYGERRPATRLTKHLKYPRSIMEDVPLVTDPKRTKRQRVAKSYAVCDNHYELSMSERRAAAMAEHHKDCDSFVVERGQMSLFTTADDVVLLGDGTQQRSMSPS